MTNHDQTERERRPSQVFTPELGPEAKTAAAPRKQSSPVQPREAGLEDFGSDYPPPPPEANGEDF